MKNLIFTFLVFLLLSGCSGNKKLQTENQDLNTQLAEYKSNLDRLSADNESLSKQINSLEVTNNEMTSNLTKCNKKLENLSSIYAAYNTKIKKMKTELEAAFPNNLNDGNFAIVEEDGRLIIRLPNKILYTSGSAEFNGEALSVIQKLSKVFRANQGLNILVEGHTDDLPIKTGSKYADNWDLSLARAVKITRQLETYGVHPQRLTAAGRAYFAPLDRIVSDEARAKNRRTEIIIRPKIAEVLKAMSELK